jgi:hypothetical protein
MSTQGLSAEQNILRTVHRIDKAGGGVSNVLHVLGEQVLLDNDFINVEDLRARIGRVERVGKEWIRAIETIYRFDLNLSKLIETIETAKVWVSQGVHGKIGYRDGSVVVEINVEEDGGIWAWPKFHDEYNTELLMLISLFLPEKTS